MNQLLPNDVLTRRDLFLELLSIWEQSLNIADKAGYKQVVRNLKTAIQVLKNTYAMHEFFDIENTMPEGERSTTPRVTNVPLLEEANFILDDDEDDDNDSTPTGQ